MSQSAYSRLRGAATPPHPDPPPRGGRDGWGWLLGDGPAHRIYSHSIVEGGFELTSKTTRFTPFTSLMTRAEMDANTSAGSRAQSAVMPSTLVTARTATTLS